MKAAFSLKFSKTSYKVATNVSKTLVKGNWDLPWTNVFMEDQRERDEKNKKSLEQISIASVTLSQKVSDADAVVLFMFKFYRISWEGERSSPDNHMPLFIKLVLHLVICFWSLMVFLGTYCWRWHDYKNPKLLGMMPMENKFNNCFYH